MYRKPWLSSKLCSCAIVGGLLLAATFHTPAPASAQEGIESVQLQAIGGLIAGYAHASYALVGTTADGYGHQVYDVERVKTLMDEMRGMQRNIIRMLRRLQGTALTKEDDDFIDDAVALFKLIDEEATLLVQFTETKDPADAEKFEEVRVQIGKDMAKLFGGGEPAEETADEGDDDKPAAGDDDDKEKKDEKPKDEADEDKPAEDDVDEEN
ncbi:MAG: hypothetical protein WD065_11125 [Planctomycetaceae bacterium]